MNAAVFKFQRKKYFVRIDALGGGRKTGLLWNDATRHLFAGVTRRGELLGKHV